VPQQTALYSGGQSLVARFFCLMQSQTMAVFPAVQHLNDPAIDTGTVQISSSDKNEGPDFLPTTARVLCRTPHLRRFQAKNRLYTV
jgi:hypothetical protein